MSSTDRALRLLRVLDEALSQAMSVRAVGAAVLEHAALFGAAEAGVYFLRDGGLELGPAWGADALEIERTRVFDLKDEHPVVEAARSNTENLHETPGGQVRIALPLAAGNEVHGVLALCEHGTAIEAQRLAFLRRAADAIGAALARAILYERAVAAADREQRVLAMLSHDLRTPLNAIGISAAILEGRGDALTCELAAQITKSVDRASRMMDRLLELSKQAHHSRVGPNQARIDLCGVAESQLDELALAFPERDVQWVSAGCPVHVQATTISIEQILSNLVRNALTHGDPDAAVTVRVVVDGRANLLVANHGPPIPPEVRERLFQPYESGSANGSGLGLYIAHRLAGELGGTLDLLHDEPTTFRLSLPMD